MNRALLVFMALFALTGKASLGQETKRSRPVLAIRAALNGRPSKAHSASIARGDDVVLSLRGAPSGAIHWYLVLPDLSRIYQNARMPWEDDAYTWTGLDRIEYLREEITPWRDRTEVRPLDGEGLSKAVSAIKTGLAASGKADSAQRFYHQDVGTFFIEAEVDAGKEVPKTPGSADLTPRGLSPRVFRLSIRPDDSLLGWIQSFYNVPGVFGSVLTQSRGHLGVDCADVLMAARSEWRGERLGRNYNVEMLVHELATKVHTSIAEGAPLAKVSWGAGGVEPGDFIAVKYPGAGRYGHIGALARDFDGDGELGPVDTVIHAGPYPLHEDPLASGAFDGEVVVLQPTRPR